MKILASLFFAIFLSEGAIVASANRSSFVPHVVSVKTTRETLSKYSSDWDIIRSSSRKETAEDGQETIHIDVVVNNPEDSEHLDHLNSEGSVSYVKNEALSHRLLQAVPEFNFDEFETNFTCYRTVDETFASIDSLVEMYPEWVSKETIGSSFNFSIDIPVMIIDVPSDVKKAPMMMVAGHHSRELPPPETVMRFAEALIEGYGTDITWILDRTSVHIVPIANPDGRKLVQGDLDLYYRKNAHIYGCESGWEMDGADLNRNYPMFWGIDEGSSNDTCSNSFRGDSPLSEPEALSVWNYADKIFPDEFKKDSFEEAGRKLEEACDASTPGIFIDVHSAGDFIYFPWGIEDVYPPNKDGVLAMVRTSTRRLGVLPHYDSVCLVLLTLLLHYDFRPPSWPIPGTTVSGGLDRMVSCTWSLAMPRMRRTVSCASPLTDTKLDRSSTLLATNSRKTCFQLSSSRSFTPPRVPRRPTTSLKDLTL
jgi:hypothetical protein